MTKNNVRAAFNVPSFDLRQWSYDEFLGACEFVSAIGLHSDQQERAQVPESVRRLPRAASSDPLVCRGRLAPAVDGL